MPRIIAYRATTPPLLLHHRGQTLSPPVTTGFAKNTYQLDEYALVVDSYKAVSREYDKLRKDRNWVAAAEFYKEHPILRHKSRLDGAIKAVGMYEKHVKQLEKAGRPVSDSLRRIGTKPSSA